MGDIRVVDSRLVISQSNGPLINVDRRQPINNHAYSATVKTCHTADVKAAVVFSMLNPHCSLALFPCPCCNNCSVITLRP